MAQGRPLLRRMDQAPGMDQGKVLLLPTNQDLIPLLLKAKKNLK